MSLRCAAAVLAIFVLLPSALRAQEGLLQQCSTISSSNSRLFCNMVVEAIEIAQPRFGLALTGGNPLAGSASTLGMRVGSVPRIAAEARVTAVKADLPPIERIGSNDEIDAAVPAINLDATIGLFDGFSVLPTVGGFLSVDLLASLGFVPLPESEGFNKNASSWAVGARLGLLRESFTAPGVSLSLMYRGVGDVDFGDSNLQTRDAFFRTSNFSVLSLRGVVGKRILFLGASAGIGWDRYKSDVDFGVANPSLIGPANFAFTEDGFDNTRVVYFGALQYTVLVLSLNLEGGYQAGGDTFTAPLPAGQSSTTQNKAAFLSFAIRLTI